MTILVTGSAGHLGEALMRILRKRGEDARGLDLKCSPFTDVVGTIADRALVRDAMRGVELAFAPAAAGRGRRTEAVGEIRRVVSGRVLIASGRT